LIATQINRGPTSIESATADMDSKEHSNAIANKADKIKQGISARSQPAVQRKLSEPEKEETLMRKEKGAATSQVSSNFQSAIDASRGGGKPIDKKNQNEFASKFGSDFSEVKIHNNSRAHQLAHDINAKAFTVGQDVYFNKGEYQPHTKKGKKLLAHELTHTLQRSGKLQKKGKAKPYEIETKSKGAVDVGSNIVYTLKANKGSKLLDSYKYLWKVLDQTGKTVFSEVTDVPWTFIAAKIPGKYVVQAHVYTEKRKWISQAVIKQNVSYKAKNTELGGLTVGNFDFEFDGNSATVEVRVKFAFESGIKKKASKGFKAKFKAAINSYWTKSNVSFTGKGNCIKRSVPLVIKLVENNSDYHKLVDVEKKYRRANVMNDVNLHLGDSKQTIAHEFGHVLGLYDEYDANWLENMMFWHDDGSHHKDKKALMNSGKEMRRRYFSKFLDKVNENAPKKCKYSLKTPFKK
jgi:hypothetical protein